jgi:hypothetical protein
MEPTGYLLLEGLLKQGCLLLTPCALQVVHAPILGGNAPLRLLTRPRVLSQHLRSAGQYEGMQPCISVTSIQ